MNPEARAAEQQLATRIQRAHGKHPTVILNDAPAHDQAQRANGRAGETTAGEDETKLLLTMPQVIKLAEQKAPYHWDRDELAELNPASDEPQTEAERGTR